MDPNCSCVTALVELHDFFAAWYRGDEHADIGLLERALGSDFRLVPPAGVVVTRDEIVEATLSKRGEHPDARIEIKPVGCTQVRGVHLATYEEWQHEEIDRPARLSTAVLTRQDEGWQWHVVHETWLDQGTSAG